MFITDTWFFQVILWVCLFRKQSQQSRLISTAAELSSEIERICNVNWFSSDRLLTILLCCWKNVLLLQCFCPNLFFYNMNNSFYILHTQNIIWIFAQICAARGFLKFLSTNVGGCFPREEAGASSDETSVEQNALFNSFENSIGLILDNCLALKYLCFYDQDHILWDELATEALCMWW